MIAWQIHHARNYKKHSRWPNPTFQTIVFNMSDGMKFISLHRPKCFVPSSKSRGDQTNDDVTKDDQMNAGRIFRVMQLMNCENILFSNIDRTFQNISKTVLCQLSKFGFVFILQSKLN